MPSPPIVYRVDRTDRIVYVNEAWDAFAHQNRGAAVTAARVVGRPLWDFISDLTTRMIYQRMLGRIRLGNELRFAFRCDSPSCRRVMQMQILQADERDAVEFRSLTITEAHRHLPLLGQADEFEEEALLRACGWCNRLDVKGAWMELEEALPRLQLMEVPSPPKVTHGICEPCAARMTAELGGI